MRALSLAIVLFISLSASAHSADEAVDIALVIAIDGSGSMDPSEQVLQRRGYVAAFTSSELLAAITSGPRGRAAITFVEWSDRLHQHVVIPWVIIDSKASAEEFSRGLDAPVHWDSAQTSISAALLFSAELFDEFGHAASRRVIDISGDGVNSGGPPLLAARKAVIAQGITINGLPIVLGDSARTKFNDIDIETYYRNWVIGGPDAFALPVRRTSDFENAIREKLVREIASAPRIRQDSFYSFSAVKVREVARGIGGVGRSGEGGE